jgi:DNA-binding NarL/FixJ family response regulator
LETAAGRPMVRRAYRLLFDACAERDNVPRRARLARLAAAHFKRMGNALYAAFAGDIAGTPPDTPEERNVPARDDLQLTPRQRQIAELVAMGETNRGIAQRLNISEHTVEHHLKGIFERLGLHSRAQVAHMLGLREHK